MAPTPELGPSAIHHLNNLLVRDLENPTKTQQITLGVIAAYVVVIAILWNVPYLKMILWPFKVCLLAQAPPSPQPSLTGSSQMLVIAFHEFGHAITAVLTGGRVKSISLDPNEGGVTHLVSSHTIKETEHGS